MTTPPPPAAPPPAGPPPSVPPTAPPGLPPAAYATDPGLAARRPSALAPILATVVAAGLGFGGAYLGTSLLGGGRAGAAAEEGNLALGCAILAETESEWPLTSDGIATNPAVERIVAGSLLLRAAAIEDPALEELGRTAEQIYAGIASLDYDLSYASYQEVMAGCAAQ